jgi:uncharacterized protein YcgL (UPF0745 family)
MQCYIYKSLKKEELYLYLSQKDDFSALPQGLFDSLGPIAFVMELQLTPTRKLARENVEKVIANLQTQGFHIQLPPTLFTAESSARRLH